MCLSIEKFETAKIRAKGAYELQPTANPINYTVSDEKVEISVLAPKFTAFW